MKKAAIGVLLTKNDQVLLIKRRDVPVWVLPGGGIEAGESPEEALIREMYEETGLEVTIQRKVATWLPINRLGSVTHLFECRAKGDIPSELSPQEESLEVRLFPIENLPPLTFFLHRDWLIHTLQHTGEPLVAPMSQLTYSSCFKLILQHPLLSLRYLLSRFGCPINA